MRLALFIVLFVQFAVSGQQDTMTVNETLITNAPLDNDSIQLFIELFSGEKIFVDKIESNEHFGGTISGFIDTQKMTYKEKEVANCLASVKSPLPFDKEKYHILSCQRSVKFKGLTEVSVADKTVLDNGMKWLMVVFSDGENFLLGTMFSSVESGIENLIWLKSTGSGSYEAEFYIHPAGFGPYNKLKKKLSADFGHIEGVNEILENYMFHNVCFALGDLFVKEHYKILE